MNNQIDIARGLLEEIPMKHKEAIMKEWVTHTSEDKKLQDAITRQIVSMLVMGIGFTLSMLGLMSGSGSEYEKEEREQLRATGWSPYSIKIKGRWISYRALPFHYLPLAICAEIVENIKNFKAKGREHELYQRVINQLYSVSMLITNLDIITSILNGLGMIVDQNEYEFNRFIASLTKVIPTQWNITKFANDIFDHRMRRPETLWETFKHENRALFSESIPTRYNVFGERLNNRHYGLSRGDGGGLGVIGWITGAGAGYTNIKDEDMLSLTKSVLEIGERLPASNGRVQIRDGEATRGVTWQEREMFLRYRGTEYKRLLRKDLPIILDRIKAIENGDESQRELLMKELRSMSEIAREYGKKMVEEYVEKKNRASNK
jgi:hypothetical protein